MRLYGRLKPVCDMLLALVALVLLLPVLAVVALLVRVRLGQPVLFRQLRPGLAGRPFRIYKFRSMREACAEDATPLPDEQRLTPLGRFLRSTSLDELPELVNVIKGEMSLVGPRPLRMSYLSRYTKQQARRHEARPGITGWAQVNGRNRIPWERKLELDVWYVDHVSPWLDLRILGLTLVKLVRREGISAEGHATVPEFRGVLDSHARGAAR